MLNENSGLVKIWVNLVKTGEYTIDDVPNLSNLKEVVLSLIQE